MKNPFLTETALLKLDWAEHHCKTRLQYLVRSGLSALNNCLVVWFNLILTWISFNRLFFSGEAFVSLSSDKDISLLGKKMFSLAFCELLCHKVKADWPWTEFITVFKDNLTTPIGTNSPVILYLIFFWFFFRWKYYAHIFSHFHSQPFSRNCLTSRRTVSSVHGWHGEKNPFQIHFCSRRRIACETNQPMLLAVLGNHHVHILRRSSGNIVLWKRKYISMEYLLYQKKVNLKG